MEQTWTDIRNSIDSQTRVDVFDNLWASLRSTVWNNVAKPIGECVKASANDSPVVSAYGQHDAYWLAFYEYLREEKGLTSETERICGLLDLAREAGWIIPHANMCWICERPNILLLDENGCLHAEHGPALAYPDGWGLHANSAAERANAAIHQ